MTEQEAILLINQLLAAARSPRGLTDIQALILRGVWQGASYQEIGDRWGYDSNYIRQVGARLWHLISDLTGEKVAKGNLQVTLETYQLKRLDKSSAIAPSHPVKENQSVASLVSLPPLLEDGEIRWVGRNSAIEDLTQNLLERSRIAILVGMTGIGKSSLAIRLTLDSRIQQNWSDIKILRLDREIDNFSYLARQLAEDGTAPHLESQSNSQQLLQGIVEYLQANPCILILDMLEEILETSSYGGCSYTETRFGELFDRLVQGSAMRSRIVLTSQINPPAIAEGRFPRRCYSLRLAGLTEAEALELFQIWDVNPASDVEFAYLCRTIHVYEGHPLALRTIAGEIREPPYWGDIESYWHDYGAEIETSEKYKQQSDYLSGKDEMTLADYSMNLTDLVKQRIERALTNLQQSAPLSYFLLCMGAVYRCAVERSGWLILIADYSSSHQAAAFQTLQRRFLLEEEYTKGKVLYRLHNLIRAVALQHLERIDVW